MVKRIAGSRKFDGLIYAYHRTYKSQIEALQQAKKHKAADYKTRIVPVAKGYALYKR